MAGSAPSYAAMQARCEAFCDGKERHASESAAWAALGYYRQRGTLRSGAKLKPYQCDFCPHWHLGNALPAAARGGRRLLHNVINTRHA